MISQKELQNDNYTSIFVFLCIKPLTYKYSKGWLRLLEETQKDLQHGIKTCYMQTWYSKALRPFWYWKKEGFSYKWKKSNCIFMTFFMMRYSSNRCQKSTLSRLSYGHISSDRRASVHGHYKPFQGWRTLTPMTHKLDPIVGPWPCKRHDHGGVGGDLDWNEAIEGWVCLKSMAILFRHISLKKINLCDKSNYLIHSCKGHWRFNILTYHWSLHSIAALISHTISGYIEEVIWDWDI